MEKDTRKKILICDDIVSIRMTLSNMLKKENFEIFEAGNGEQAINNYKIVKPDVVIMDLSMPKINGIEALEEIKKMDSQAKVIMCSAISEPYTINTAFNKGALDFIIKPFSSEKIIEAISKIIN